MFNKSFRDKEYVLQIIFIFKFRTRRIKMQLWKVNFSGASDLGMTYCKHTAENSEVGSKIYIRFE